MSSCPTCLGPHTEVREPSAAVIDLLELLRRRMRMDLAGLGRLDGNLLIMQEASGNARMFGLAPGCSMRREQGLFGRVLTGELPSLISDTHRDPRTANAASVLELGIGAYAAMPVFDADGAVYGAVGCLSREPLPFLGPRDIRFLGLLADFLTEYVSDLHGMWEARSRMWRRVHDLIDGGGPQIHLQPIVDLHSGQAVAVEALSRFPDSTRPGSLFADAAAVGLGPELETTAVHRALALLPDLPPYVRLEVNASPTTVTSGLIDVLLSTGAPRRLALEITEHEYVDENHDLLAALAILRGHGVHIVIDDMGTCYSGLQLLLQLRPDVIKIDRYIVRGMATDPAHWAVAEGLARIAHGIGAQVVAEGIESAADLTAARTAGIDYGQGFFLGRPTADLDTACLVTRPALVPAGQS
ncbi:EAL domain-containing protein [Pseudofrankia sp. BMG5.37]|uniref:sensor domain-containing phosphodiesterase n=1 Tax=Pseudofrankia sp. BMG5.37 TaxID=3050035 RepID=UPI002893ECB0|nr:EAL domain-containing protein [Pseudofrankia sp. BMG5.37]MDT3445092.1 EAL domain-containing protein [Pseudofrankia sp. BMG5.37]